MNADQKLFSDFLNEIPENGNEGKSQWPSYCENERFEIPENTENEIPLEKSEDLNEHHDKQISKGSSFHDNSIFDHPLLITDLSTLTGKINQPDNEKQSIIESQISESNLSDLNLIITQLSDMDLERNQQAYRDWCLRKSHRLSSTTSSNSKKCAVSAQQTEKSISKFNHMMERASNLNSNLEFKCFGYTLEELKRLSRKEVLDLLKRKERNDRAYQEWLDRKNNDDSKSAILRIDEKCERDNLVHRKTKNAERVQAWVKTKAERERLELMLKEQDQIQRKLDLEVRRSEAKKAFNNWIEQQRKRELEEKRMKEYDIKFTDKCIHPQPWIGQEMEENLDNHETGVYKLENDFKIMKKNEGNQDFKKLKSKKIPGTNKISSALNRESDNKINSVKKVNLMRRKKMDPSPPKLWKEYGEYIETVPGFVKKYPLLVASGGKAAYLAEQKIKKRKERETQSRPWTRGVIQHKVQDRIVKI
ncbi:hypothetical protein HK096_010925 [Nowakowskiella sp. JEL0078]|nr:hypothetical protein HK096_010925 [Nowakowskiella sp. JEL0078]